jgi:predicted transcriptional regulator
MVDNDNLIQLTADIVSSMVGSNNVATADVPGLIKSVHSALNGLGAPAAEPEAEKPKGAVSPRASIKPDGLISMIDGKKYQTLRRHITRHGYTPESYREAFGLPRDYPLTSANYSELRRGMAKLIGLGRKTAESVIETVVPGPETSPAEPAKRGRKPRAAKPADVAEAPLDTAAPEPVAKTGNVAPETPAETAPKPKRGRPRKAVAEAAPAISEDAAPAENDTAKEAPAPKKRRAKKLA